MAKISIGDKFGYLIVVSNMFHKKSIRYVECKCVCGRTKPIRCHYLLIGKAKTCGCHFKDVMGNKFGKLTVISLSPERGKRNEKYWMCKCDCGKTARVMQESLLSKKTQSCGCLRLKYGSLSYTWKGYELISGHFWSNIVCHAKEKNLPMDITIKDGWELIVKQNFKCALSGVDIKLSIRDRWEDQTASLDRKNSKKGYTLDNIQWVHKHINRMKNYFDQEYFIEICNLIAKKHPI